MSSTLLDPSSDQTVAAPPAPLPPAIGDEPAAAATSRAAARGDWRLLPGLSALGMAGVLAFVIAVIHRTFGDRPATAFGLVAGACAFLALSAPVAVLLQERRRVRPSELAIALLLGSALAILGVALYSLGAQVVYPGDFLIWSESDFVNDVIKLRTGYPFYSDEANNESLVYMPGAPLLTYLLTLAWAVPPIPVMRGLQLAIAIGGAVVAVLCLRELAVLAGVRTARHRAWDALALVVMTLIATNHLTNEYVATLHNDALTLLLSAVSYWVLLRYANTRDRGLLAAMVVLVCAGYFVKQSLAAWAGLFVLYLVLFDTPRRWRRAVAVTGAAAVGIATIVLTCWLLWGDAFFYWTLTVLRVHPHSPLRAVQHAFDAWIFFAIGIAGALILLPRHGGSDRRLLGVWLCWLLFLSAEAWTSGVAWMHNHMGPGSLLAGVWLLLGVRVLWDRYVGDDASPAPLARWMHGGIAAVLGLMVTAGLHVVRPPVDPLGPDARRYAAEIAREFDGLPAERVLLDAGSWLYLPSGTVQKDRVVTFGDRGVAALRRHRARACRGGPRPDETPPRGPQQCGDRPRLVRRLPGRPAR